MKCVLIWSEQVRNRVVRQEPTRWNVEWKVADWQVCKALNRTSFNSEPGCTGLTV